MNNYRPTPITPGLMKIYAEALRPLPESSKGPMLPLATAQAQAAEVIQRAHDSAPMFTDVSPPLQSAAQTAQKPPGGAKADGVDTTQPPPPIPLKTGKYGREILTLKKRKVIR
jgi:hypothetical protein